MKFGSIYIYISLEDVVSRRLLQPMFQRTISFPSGRSETVWIAKSSKAGDLMVLAQWTLGQQFLKLITTKGHYLLVDPTESLQAAELQDGDCITAVALQANVAATRNTSETGGAFALWGYGGSTIVTRGHSAIGGDSSAVQDQLRNVQQVQATSAAFAAILQDGSVVAWGGPDSVGYNGCCHRGAAHYNSMQ